MRLAPHFSALALTAAQVLASLATLLTLVVLGRAFPTSELSLYLYMLAVINAAEPLSDLGLRFSAVIRFADCKSAEETLDTVDSCWIVKLVLSGVTVLGILLLTAIGVLRFSSVYDVLLAGATAVTLPSANPLIWRLRSKGLQWVEAIGLVAYKFGILGGLMALDLAAANAPAAIVVMLAANVLFYMFCALMANLPGGNWRLRFPSQRSMIDVISFLLSRGAHFGGALLLGQVSTRIWVLVLGFFGLTGAVVGFSVSQSLVLTTLLFGVALGNVYFPALSGQAARGDWSAHGALAHKLICVGATLGAATGIGLYICAAELLALMLNEPPQNAVTILRVLAWAPAAILVSFLSRFILASSNRGGLELNVAVGALVLALVVGVPTASWSGGLGIAVLYCVIEYGTAAAKIVLGQADRAFGIAIMRDVALRVIPAIPVALMISAMTADASDWRTLVVASAAALGYVLIAGIRDLRWFLTHR